MTSYYLKCTWGKTHYVHYNPSSTGACPIIALHGWLDNQASFLPLSQYLNYEIFSIDLPGHGYSSHQTAGNRYHFVDYIEKLHEIIEKLQLDEFYLMGHSMGAAVASLYSSIFPEKIMSLILIDGLGPLVNKAEDAPKVLRQAILSNKVKKRKRYFQDIEQAAKIRHSVGQLSLKSATYLVEGQLSQGQSGLYWSYDPKLSLTSSLRMTPEQLKAFLQTLKVKTLLIEANDGLLVNFPYKNSLHNNKSIEYVKLDGQHHLHMDSPKIVAQAIKEFLS